MKRKLFASAAASAAILASAMAGTPAWASSHMDAPLITYDDPANTTDVYAFLSEDEDQNPYLTTALSVYPFEEPGIGPNNYSFDPRVIYQIHVSLEDDVAKGRSTISYRFDIESRFRDRDTILQSYLGEVGVNKGRFTGRNLTQTYRVTKIDHRTGRKTVLGRGVVPPNNQGLVTPLYNQNLDGEMPAKEGVTRTKDLDAYTRAAIADLRQGYTSFAGQRDDGFYADIQSIFDLDFSFGKDFATPTKPFDSQGGFNVHTIVLNIPMKELRKATVAGVHATTSRTFRIGRGKNDDEDAGKRRKGSKRRVVRVGRQGNPLFAEALVAIRDKDRYNRTSPRRDSRRFGRYADDPELARVLGVQEILPGLIRSIFIPDMIKVDLTTGPARLAGQQGFDRLGVFGGDVLKSRVQDPFNNGGFIPGGWPNGRRFGDDVLDIALIALGAAGPADPDEPDFGFSGTDFDGVTENDISFNQVFPYAATPLNGRNHGHHGELPAVF